MSATRPAEQFSMRERELNELYAQHNTHSQGLKIAKKKAGMFVGHGVDDLTSVFTCDDFAQGQNFA